MGVGQLQRSVFRAAHGRGRARERGGWQATQAFCRVPADFGAAPVARAHNTRLPALGAGLQRMQLPACYPEQARMREEQVAGLFRHVGALEHVPEIGFTGADTLGVQEQPHVPSGRGADGALTRRSSARTAASFPSGAACWAARRYSRRCPGALDAVSHQIQRARYAGRVHAHDKARPFGLNRFRAFRRQARVLSSGAELVFEHGGTRLAYGADTFFRPTRR